ncbi:hypothetical protein [Pandoraea terrigena]|uniref:Uncharacterized protein n=1 Tax=Pandoraea terrigena TaxID=2508292 RepID=A0A5E4YWA3_9BURK|nr:hypothetical protein [Pandoraea terrigena]VVE52728.1 hypothetical protein PTE31013_04836 [Pandoraea terrigena]
MNRTEWQDRAYDTASTSELFAAMDRRSEAINARFAEHVARVSTLSGRALDPWNPEVRSHVVPKDGEALPSDTRIFWGEELKPLLVGTVVREVNHMLLVVVDRSGPVPVVFEDRFDARDFI